jgi:hypothetical protein
LLIHFSGEMRKSVTLQNDSPRNFDPQKRIENTISTCITSALRIRESVVQFLMLSFFKTQNYWYFWKNGLTVGFVLPTSKWRHPKFAGLFFKNAWHFKDILKKNLAFLKLSIHFEDIFREIEAFFN